MNITKDNIQEYFSYNPPKTEKRKFRHNQINEAALAFALSVLQNVDDEDCRKMAFFAIQQARMFANQGITVDEIAQQPSMEYEKVSYNFAGGGR